LKRLLDTWFEQDCLLCASPSGGEIVCEACEADLPRLEGGQCPQCALPAAGGCLCGHCLSKPPHFDSARAVFRYDFPVDKLMHSFKYAHRLALGAYFGKKMATLPRPEIADSIVPLPLHPDRLRERGFNQSLELAKTIAKIWKIPVDGEKCERIRNTPAQAGLPWKDRAGNIRNAFRYAENCEGKHFILIDDVMTTGASLSECARAIKRRGAARVDVLVLARTLPP
jgi:ComF family protein